MVISFTRSTMFARTTEVTSADGYIAALATTQDRTFAFSASKKSVLDNEDYSISQSELGAGKRVGTFKHAGRVNALAVSGDGRRLVSGSEDKKLTALEHHRWCSSSHVRRFRVCQRMRHCYCGGYSAGARWRSPGFELEVGCARAHSGIRGRGHGGVERCDYGRRAMGGSRRLL